MALARIRLTQEFLRQVLLMPDWPIVDAVLDDETRTMRLVVDAAGLSPGHEGELSVTYTRDENGEILAKWTPREPPSPSTFFPNLKTGLCFWCGKHRDFHGPDGACVAPIRTVGEPYSPVEGQGAD